jgi:hypothetical protein
MSQLYVLKTITHYETSTIVVMATLVSPKLHATRASDDNRFDGLTHKAEDTCVAGTGDRTGATVVLVGRFTNGGGMFI